jgi:hypothetical protein
MYDCRVMAEANRAKQLVDGKRVALQQFRADACQRIVGGTVGKEAKIPEGTPPSYPE